MARPVDPKVRVFRDRCARAMGWLEFEHCWGAKQLDGSFKYPSKEGWQPDADYNHAVAMRDEAIKRTSVVDFGTELMIKCCPLGLSCDHIGQNGGVCESVTRATSRHIAEAALAVLEHHYEASEAYKRG